MAKKKAVKTVAHKRLTSKAKQAKAHATKQRPQNQIQPETPEHGFTTTRELAQIGR